MEGVDASAAMPERLRAKPGGESIPVTMGDMAQVPVSTERFRHSVLDPLLARINHHVQKWIRRKYRRLRPYRAMKRAWNRITTQNPGLLPHWRWVTSAGY